MSGVTAITAGPSTFYSVALKSDSTVVAWPSGPPTVPDGLSGVTAIAAGASHTVALKSDGTVVAWGGNTYFQTTVPAGLSAVAAIAAGGSHNLALIGSGVPPSFTTQPQSQTVVAGNSVTFGVVASGTSPLSYQWYKNSMAIVGATASSLSLNNVQSADTGSYTVSVANSAGTVTSSTAALTVNPAPPAITSQPASQTVNQGANVALTVAATGTTPLGYQWRKSGIPIAGASGATLTLNNVQPSDASTYDVVITNVVGIATSSVASLVVNVPPTITTQPVSQTVAGGTSAAFNVTATGTAPFLFQWRKDGTNLTGSTGSSHLIANAQATDSGSYTVVVSNAGGSITSSPPAVLIVNSPPNVMQQPQNLAVTVTSNAAFSVTATGSSPLSYQWRKDGTNLAGATSTTLTLSNVQTNQAGNYVVVITNAYGSVTSSVAALAVVVRFAQSINFASLPAKRLDDAPFTLAATSSTGLPLNFTSSNPGVATVNGNTVTIRGTGTAMIMASQPGDATFLPKTVGAALRVATLGKVVGWGGNGSSPTAVPAGLSNVIAIAVGSGNCMALKSDGSVVCWLNNSTSQSPVPVGLGGVVAIATGGLSLALRSDGTVMEWDSSGVQTSVPVGLTSVTAIAEGGSHAAALKSDGTVVTWGSNSYGQTNVPAGLSGVTAISAGWYHTMALKSDGTVTAWGASDSVIDYGQASVPAALNGVVAVAAGGFHSMALKSDGTVVAWGNNSYGQSAVSYSLNDVGAIAAGRLHSVALKRDGTVKAWGWNSLGQSQVPTGLSGVAAIAVGNNSNLALVSTVPPIFPAQFQSQSVVSGANAAFSVAATGVAPMTYQWMKDGVLLTDQTNAQLNLSGLTNRATGGSFSVMVSNLYGAITGNIGSLRVRVPHRLQPPVATNGIFRLFSADQDGGLLTTNDLPYFSVQISTNLSSTNWMSFTYSNGLSLTSGMLRLDDTNAASRPFRYYRVFEQ